MKITIHGNLIIEKNISHFLSSLETCVSIHFAGIDENFGFFLLNPVNGQPLAGSKIF